MPDTETSDQSKELKSEQINGSKAPSFQSDHPEMVKSWDFELNDVKPHQISTKSREVLHWICPLDHKYTRTIKSQLRTGCPYCAGRKVLPGFNSLRDKNPELADEFDEEANGISASEILPTSTVSYQWLCKTGNPEHVWKAIPYHRTVNGTGCPYCKGLRVCSSNSVLSIGENCREEWDYELNDVDPATVAKSSPVKYYWRCKYGHVWKTSPAHRTSKSGCTYCSGRNAMPNYNTLEDLYPEVEDYWDYTKNEKPPSEFRPGSKSYAWWTCKSGHSSFTPIKDVVRRGMACPKCGPSVSDAENEIAEFLSQHVDIMQNTRKVVPPKELDIYIPSLNLAVEYNGIYYHSERTKEKDVHKQKWEECADKGIQLITIWEDEWLEKPDIVKRMLLHKIGASTEKKVYARKTEVVCVEQSTADSFLDKYHIQGHASGSIRAGLRSSEGDLVAVCVFTRQGGELTLSRYATSCTVPGGQSKILAWIDKNVDYDTMKTFADLSVSDGSLYEKTGWIQDKVLKPDYKYVVGAKRVHKFNYRIKRFRDDPSLQYQEGLTERELAQLNGLYRIYDCGKIRYTRQKDGGNKTCQNVH